MESLIASVDVPTAIEWKETVMGVKGLAPLGNCFGLDRPFKC